MVEQSHAIVVNGLSGAFRSFDLFAKGGPASQLVDQVDLVRVLAQVDPAAARRPVHPIGHGRHDVARLTTEMYLSDMVPAMRPSDAFAKMAHREIERVPIDELEGRVTAMLVTPYPPGIPLLIPGERFNRTIVRYLQFVREFNLRFPGFETDVHGLVSQRENGRIDYFVDCVKQG